MTRGNPKHDPTTIVIFGGTGDLARKKLLSALMDLFSRDLLPEPFRIIGFSRRKFSHEDYRAFVRKVFAEKGHEHAPEEMEDFLSRVFYKEGDLENITSYRDLGQCLEDFDSRFDSCPNRLLYLAIPPKFYDRTFTLLCDSGIGRSGEGRWVRVLVEKPFGSDYESAQALDKTLGSLFEEEQIYRIDHYLAKSAVQNILTFRFANSLFENSWNQSSVERVHIRLFESFGVEERAAFYDGIGALRDVGQNHMLQILALVGMENPKALAATALRPARTRLLSRLRLHEDGGFSSAVLRGQYNGYRDIADVPRDSLTETYFALKVRIDTERWRGVPFILESGKRLHETGTEVEIVFKPPSPCLCGKGDLSSYRNSITIGVKPTQAIDLRFWGKKSGFSYELEPRDLRFESRDNGNIPDAYEKVLYDALLGDQMLFTSTEEVEAAWKFITPIIEQWSNLPLHRYPTGSEGPSARGEFLAAT